MGQKDTELSEQFFPSLGSDLVSTLVWLIVPTKFIAEVCILFPFCLPSDQQSHTYSKRGIIVYCTFKCISRCKEN